MYLRETRGLELGLPRLGGIWGYRECDTLLECIRPPTSTAAHGSGLSNYTYITALPRRARRELAGITIHVSLRDTLKRKERVHLLMDVQSGWRSGAICLTSNLLRWEPPSHAVHVCEIHSSMYNDGFGNDYACKSKSVIFYFFFKKVDFFFYHTVWLPCATGHTLLRGI